MTGSLPLSFVLGFRSLGFPLMPPPPLPPSPPLPPLGMLKGYPILPNHLGSGSSPGGSPPFWAEDGSPSVAMVCIGSFMVCLAMMVVMGGNLEVAVLLLGLMRVGMDSANFSSCLSLFSSSLVGILMSMLSG